jgi:predicted Zn-dependent protease
MKTLSRCPRLTVRHWIGVLGVLLWTSCHTVPETGRSAFNIIPASQELALGEEAFASLKKESANQIVRSGAQYEMLRRVGQRIARVSAQPNASWEFVLFKDDDNVNAFALPGGKVGVYTGMFKLIDKEDELAIVIGHEIGHVVARHGVSRMSTQLMVGLGGVAIGAASSDMSSEEQAMVLGAYGVSSELFVALPYSRSNEVEADHIGLIYAARAGYDPRVAIGFWEKMGRMSGGESFEILSTHPASTTRIEEMKKVMPKAMDEYRRARPDLF